MTMQMHVFYPWTQTVYWAHTRTTWKKMERWRKSVRCTCSLCSTTLIRMPSTFGTKTTSSFPYLSEARAPCPALYPALWLLSSQKYLIFSPTPIASTARPTISRSRGRVMPEATHRIRDICQAIFIPSGRCHLLSLVERLQLLVFDLWNLFYPNLGVGNIVLISGMISSKSECVTNPATSNGLQSHFRCLP